MRNFGLDDLDAFVTDVDSLGGPASEAFFAKWCGYTYQPTMVVDPALDAYGEDYMASMSRLYKEISGRDYNLMSGEFVQFVLDAHVSTPSAYGAVPPENIALHFQRLALAVRKANLKAGASVLDMGCGWGLSSEVLAQCGCVVTSVDINSKFVELVSRRAKRLDYPIKTLQSSFQDFATEARFDAVLFYECLHHEREPWSLLKKLAGLLKDGGKIILVGEPIQNTFWNTWGLRLDPLSVYCIRKYGWFESGWSLGFLRDMLARAGLLSTVHISDDPEVGFIVTAEYVGTRVLDANALLNHVTPSQWHVEPGFLISKGRAQLRLWIPDGCSQLELSLSNFRGKNIKFQVIQGGKTISKGVIGSGSSQLVLPVETGLFDAEIISDTWFPERELGNGDSRSLSFHCSGMRIIG